MVCKPQLPNFWGALYFYGASVHIKFVFLLLIYLSYVNLIIRLAKEPRREGGKVFLPLHFPEFSPNGSHKNLIMWSPLVAKEFRKSDLLAVFIATSTNIAVLI